MTQLSEGFDFTRDGVDPNQWPKLSCSQANQLALEVSDLRLDANREILFQGNGQLTASGDMLFLTGGSSPEKFRILANGNVGIGTTMPTEKLEVAGKIKATELEASGTVKAVTFQGDGSALTGKVSTAGDTINGSLTIQNALTVSGNVGIGTTTPTEKLEVVGKIKATELEASGTVKAVAFQGDGSALTGKVSTTGDTMTGSLTIQNSLTVSGNVGIGTTNPTYKLDVAGDIKASSIHSKPKVFSFKVEGDFDKFYPIIFSDDNWSDGLMVLEINRPSVHTDSRGRGSLNSKFTCPYSALGNKANFCRAEIYSSENQFIAGYENYYYTPRFVIWLRGGGTTYFWRANHFVRLEDDSASEKYFYDSEQAQAYYPIKEEIDPYVLTSGISFDKNFVVQGNVGIGTTNPTYKLDVAGDIKASSIHSKPKVFSFKVAGDFDKFYPVVFGDDSWNDGPTELEINRPNIHTDSGSRGSLNSKFTFHSSNWGHGADFSRAEIYYSQRPFIAGYQNYYYNPLFIVWLRGGGTTYYWRSKAPITLKDYSAKEKVVELSKEYTLKYPYTAVTYPVKTNIDSYVQAIKSP